jgi:sulfonate transport system permease protein
MSSPVTKLAASVDRVADAAPRLLPAARPRVVPAGQPRQRAGRLWVAGQYLVFPVALLALWSVMHTQGIISERILPGPAAVARTFWELWSSGELTTHLAVSLGRVVRGAALGLALGLLLGLALGFSATLESWVGPSFRTLAQIPSIALIPLLMSVLGIDDKLKLFIMVKACIVPLALVTADGIRNLPRGYLELGQVFRLRRATFLRRIVLPGALPSIFTGVRQGLAHVWVSLVAVEVLASADGLGYLMTWGRLIFQLDIVLVCVVLIGAIGLALDLGLKRAEGRLLRWRGGVS